MTFDEYDVKTGATLLPSSNNLTYLTLGLASEAGEVAGKLKKIIRDTDGEMSEEQRVAMLKEVGDVAWYISRLSIKLGSSMEKVCEMNFLKLQSRAERGTIKGSSDER